MPACAPGPSGCWPPTRSSAGFSSARPPQFQARLNLAKCFRSHGINVPDPSTGGGAAGGGGLFRALRNYSQAQVTAARQACQQYFTQAFPRLNVSPAQRAQLRQQLVKFAECMRSHGVNIPDPTTNGNGFGFRQQFRSIDRNSPAFQSANKAWARRWGPTRRSARPAGRGTGGHRRCLGRPCRHVCRCA